MASVAATVIKRPRAKQLRLSMTISADSYFDLPAGYALTGMWVENLTANAITGGLDIGTTDGGVDIASAFAVAGSAIKHIAEASLLLRYFSRTAVQRIYVIAHTSWNSANINIVFAADKVSP